MNQLRIGRNEKTLTPQHHRTTIVLIQGAKKVASDSRQDAVFEDGMNVGVGVCVIFWVGVSDVSGVRRGAKAISESVGAFGESIPTARAPVGSV